ncbi:hypothetical protein BABINDRAFT_15547 [Babjeviella inositovora NRRL Y-12698]|uniref:Major facilitator superfamily (MFS) profile domain-containing protein n=1 Tax=Babjeviella inositovora NRRL Y-12698 TaxID=984486 RepID=A0A1E3QHX2_9ASCO|nr:uncharacterized protein BABINDRAFT_15547 [Babjeviella inositovora NRRL Y-12698]ODQ77295.1 hypothetical protein BABINDRAFT_15547 [Babjeviella inositovora NRRL Y-12698]
MATDFRAQHYTDDFIPGTINILSNDGNTQVGLRRLKTVKHGKQEIILSPQPSESPNDPLNWSTTRKIGHFVLVSYITGLTAAIANDALAAQTSLNEVYGISYAAMNTGAGVLFLGIGYATLVFAPLSSLYGRRITYLICILSGLLGNVWFATSTKTADTIWSQLFVGVSEACAEAQVQLLLSDIFFQHQLGSVLTVYILATSIGTFLGPLFAHLISSSQGFRWVGWWAVIICGGSLIVLIFGLEETYFDRKLYTLAGESDYPQVDVQVDDTKGLEDEPDVSDMERCTITNGDGSSEPLLPYRKRIRLITKATNLKGYGFKQYWRYFVMNLKIFTFPAVWLSGLLWGTQDLLLSFYLTTQDSKFYDEPWNLSETGVALMNIPTLIGACIGCLYAGVLSDYHTLWLAKRNNGVQEAEFRLWLSFLTLVVSPTGLLLFGICTGREFPWPAIYVGLGFIGFGWGASGDLAMSYLMDAYPELVLEGMVGVAIINNTTACIFTFVCSLWLDSAGTEKSYIALAVVNFAVICLIIPFLKWGKTWRIKTKDAYLRYVELREGI